MKISVAQTDERTLAGFGAEAVALLESRNFSRLGERFGYVLADGRDVTQAIREDFEHCLPGAEGASRQNSPSIHVKYFKPNSTSIYAVVTCVAPICESSNVLIELVVFSNGEEKHIALEEISRVP